jgi:hypothetical protein
MSIWAAPRKANPLLAATAGRTCVAHVQSCPPGDTVCNAPQVGGTPGGGGENGGLTFAMQPVLHHGVWCWVRVFSYDIPHFSMRTARRLGLGIRRAYIVTIDS